MRMELKQKGVDSYQIESLLAGLSLEVWEDIASEQLIRKFPVEPDSVQGKQKAWRFLMQRGFDSEIIKSALANAWVYK